jgi:hypothetical protein
MPLFISRAALLLSAVLFTLPASADEGHDHDTPAATTSAPASPRFAAESENFELVGVLDGLQLTVYLDRHDDNTPVKDARIELALGADKLALAPTAEGTYHATLARPLPDGTSRVTATVAVGTQTDRLSTQFELHADAHAHEEAGPARSRYVAVTLAALGLAGFAAWAVRRARSQRPATAGAAR